MAGAAWNGEIRRQRLRRTGNLRDNPRRARVDAIALARDAEVDFGRGGEQAARGGGGKIPIELRRGVGHSGLALNGERKQGMRDAARRPGVFVDAEEPDGVSVEARGLGGSGDQNGRVPRLGREERFVDGLVERGKEFFPINAASVEAQRSAVIHSLLPAVEGLKFGACERARSGPAGKLKQLGRELGPRERSLRAARELLQPALGLRDARDPRGRQFGSRFLAKELRKQPARSLQIAAAKGLHEGAERARFVS